MSDNPIITMMPTVGSQGTLLDAQLCLNAGISAIGELQAVALSNPDEQVSVQSMTDIGWLIQYLSTNLDDINQAINYQHDLPGERSGSPDEPAL